MGVGRAQPGARSVVAAPGAASITLPETPLVARPFSARPDEVFDRFARLVRTTLRVPTAVISFTAHELQVFPGAVGLPEPWQTTRCVPLRESLCRVVTDGAHPLVVSDWRVQPDAALPPVALDAGVVAYAGLPLRSASGAVIGSLCALDRTPRDWTAGELALLADLAATCEGELALREALAASRASGAAAERARDAATTAELAAVGQRQEAEDARARSELLLELSEAMAATREVDDVVAAVAGVARRGLGAVYAGVALVDERERTMRHLSLERLSPAVSSAWTRFSLDDTSPLAVTARLRTPFFHEGVGAFLTDFPHLADDVDDMRLGALVHLPLLASGAVVGALSMGWPRARVFSASDRQVMAALADYTAQALQRCVLLAAERGVAATLARSLLTTLPSLDQLEVLARYVPAATGHEVGGDWYDGFVTPDGALTIAIGDVTGHDVQAAAVMGQLRASLRTVVVALDAPPARSLAVVDRALADLAMAATATVVLARVEELPGGEGGGGPRRVLRWSNAGHPPPLLLLPDGRVQVLASEPELLLGAFPDLARTDHTADLPDGSTLLLYSDGLVERRDADLDAGTARLAEAVARRAGLPLGELLDEVVTAMVGEGAQDDVALLGVRTQGREGGVAPGPSHRGP